MKLPRRGERDPDDGPRLRGWMHAAVAAVFVVSAAGGVLAVTRITGGQAPAGAAVARDTPSPDPSPSPHPSASPSAVPSERPSPAPTPSPEPTESPVPAPTAAGACPITAYAEVDRDPNGSSVDILSTLEGVCPTRTLVSTLTLLTDAGLPAAVVGNPATTSFVCPSTCTPIGPGEGYGAVHTGIRPAVWSNWCAGPGLFRATVRMVENGVATSTTVLIAAPPTCTATGQPSRLTVPAS